MQKEVEWAQKNEAFQKQNNEKFRRLKQELGEESAKLVEEYQKNFEELESIGCRNRRII